MSTLREAAEEALRWMEHARLHLTIKERMHPDGLGLYDNAAEALRAALAKPVADAPRDEWRLASEPPEDGRQVLGWQKRGYWDAVHFLNGNWFVEATGRHTLTITHWRDVTPPTEAQT